MKWVLFTAVYLILFSGAVLAGYIIRLCIAKLKRP